VIGESWPDAQFHFIAYFTELTPVAGDKDTEGSVLSNAEVSGGLGCFVQRSSTFSMRRIPRTIETDPVDSGRAPLGRGALSRGALKQGQLGRCRARGWREEMTPERTITFEDVYEDEGDGDQIWRAQLELALRRHLPQATKGECFH
jgi:hypothetical protein